VPSTQPLDAHTFSADSLELAMAEAVSTLGPGLTVLQAQRVRAGMRGLRGKDRYEVVAQGSGTAPSRPAGPGAAPGTSNGVPGAALDGLWGQAAQPEQLPEATGWTPVHAEEPEPFPDVVVRHPEVALDAVLTPPSPQLPQVADRHSLTHRAPHSSPGWSRAGLHDLGVPEAILSALPEEDPTDDLAWLVALTQAIASVVPPPAMPSAEEPAVLSGWGIRGAVALLEDGARGWPVGTLSDVGRSEPATAVELALAIRRHVLASTP
jgi:hypothetical protein